MTEGRTESLLRFTRVFYFVCFLLVVTPVVDFGTNVLPWTPGEIQWRYGAVGLVSGFLMTPLLGAALFAALAAWHGDRTLQRALGILWLGGGVVLLIACAGFALDLVQLRADVPAVQRRGFDIAGLKALAKNMVGGVAFAWLGLVAVRTRKRGGPSPKRPMVQFPADAE